MDKQYYETELITKYMEQNAMSKTAFARICKINISSLSKIIMNKTNIRLNTLYKVTRVLNVGINCFLIE